MLRFRPQRLCHVTVHLVEILIAVVVIIQRRTLDARFRQRRVNRVLRRAENQPLRFLHRVQRLRRQQFRIARPQ